MEVGLTEGLATKGSNDGEADGLDSIGAMLGFAEGSIMGPAEGGDKGEGVGSNDLGVGKRVGAAEGLGKEGCKVGERVGILDGKGLMPEGAGLFESVGDAVGAAVGGRVSDGGKKIASKCE